MNKGKFSRVVGASTHGYFKVTMGAIGLGAVFLSLLTIYVTSSVVGRYTANYPLPGTHELVRSMLVLLVFLSMARTQALGQHLRLGFFLNRLPPRGQFTVDLLTLLIGIVLSGLMGWQASIYAWESWQRWDILEGTLGVPYLPSRVGCALGITLLFIQYIIDFSKRIKERAKAG